MPHSKEVLDIPDITERLIKHGADCTQLLVPISPPHPPKEKYHCAILEICHHTNDPEVIK